MAERKLESQRKKSNFIILNDCQDAKKLYIKISLYIYQNVIYQNFVINTLSGMMQR